MPMDNITPLEQIAQAKQDRAKAAMPRTKKTLDEMIAEAEETRKQAAARLSELRGRKQSANRKADNHRKIVIGGAMLADSAMHPETARLLRDVLRRAVTRDIDKEAVADLLMVESGSANQGK
jgi:hypothetical protein